MGFIIRAYGMSLSLFLLMCFFRALLEVDAQRRVTLLHVGLSADIARDCALKIKHSSRGAKQN